MVTQTRQNAFNIRNRYSTMNKLRVIACCLRFVENVKLPPNQRRGGELTPSELDQAWIVILKKIQQEWIFSKAFDLWI
jgi:hypothetical protein